MLSWRPLLTVMLIFSAVAHGQDECPECASAFSRSPDVQAWMQSQGFNRADFDVVVAWSETSLDRDPIHGLRLHPKSGGDSFDLYHDDTGQLLDTAALKRLGIAPKTWDRIHVETNAETAVGGPATPVPAPYTAALKQAWNAIHLPELDRATLLADDANVDHGPKGVLRTGVFQSLPQPLTLDATKASVGMWQVLPSGKRVWSATIVSPGAIGQRIQFSALSLPAGGYVIVYNASDPEERYGPFTAIPVTDSDFWTPTCFNDAVTIEAVLPVDGEMSLKIERIAHIYRGLDELPWGAAKAPAGACNLDFSCYSNWATTGNGVGGIGTIGNDGTLFCTGTLIVDTDPSTQIPYFLTANHCVPGAGNPNSIEVYWFYQRVSCGGGAVPNPSSVPRTIGGADLLATSARGITWTGTDFTLLRLRNAPPAGATFVGWTSLPQDAGEPTTCIHHPRGDFKRITFGTYTEDNDSCFIGTPPPSSMYYQSTWYAGTTEGGSSGSPLLRQDTQRIIGQLWGGFASCNAPTCPDYYGRFDVSFPMMANYLHSGAATRTVKFESSAATVSEDTGEVTLTVTLTVLPVSGETVRVDYATGEGSATANADYVETSGTLVFSAFQTTGTIVIPIIEDGIIEADETFAVVLSSPVGATLAAPTLATVTIQNNDSDSDGDGLSDYDELNGTYGYITNPNDPDTDGDGVDDWLEIKLGTDPTNPGDVPSIPSLKVPLFR